MLASESDRDSATTAVLRPVLTAITITIRTRARLTAFMAPVGFRVAYSSALVRGTTVTTAAVGADVATTVAATGTVVDMATVADMAMAAAIAGTAAELPAAPSAEATRFTAVAPSMVEEASTVAVAGSTAADTVAEVIANRT